MSLVLSIALCAALGALAGACGGPGSECLTHLDCLADHGAGWYCLLGTCYEQECTPNCGARECGPVPNDCNQIPDCGTCTGGEACNEGTGMCECTPDCGARMCGPVPNGCGDSCGTCTEAGEACEPTTGLCLPCVSECGARACGQDPGPMHCGPCGPLDGACPAGEICDPAAGECGPCPSECGARECGQDPGPSQCGPCGPLDGACPAGEACDLATGACVCTPACGTRVCGPDPQGCGTSCGACAAGERCEDGDCLPCAPDCGALECGPDPQGCGTSCGACTEPGEGCDTASGACIPCASDCEARECGPAPNGCGFCGPLVDGACPAGEACGADGACACVPSCGARECGPDPVCGTVTCGVCAPDRACSPDGLCVVVDGQEPGEPCAFDAVNPDAGECAAGAMCLGVAPDPESPCAEDADCLADFPASYNADCVGGACGVSFCAEPCVDGACEAPFEPGNIQGGECYCFPPSGGTVQPGGPCEFDTVNVGTGACVASATCLGIAPDPEAPCTLDEDCFASYPESYNPDCVGGSCGVSFCAELCVDGACEAPFEPGTIQSGECYCFPPSGVIGTRLPGEPCTFQAVNPEAGSCIEDVVCLGIASDPDAPCALSEDCLEFYPQAYNPYCVAGFCGVSFCAEPCVDGACTDPFEPNTIQGGACYCFPPTGGSGQVGDICSQQAPCAAGLDCIGTQTSLSFCTEVCDCEAGTGCTVASWECMWSNGATPATCWCGLPCPSQTDAECPNTEQWDCVDIGETEPFYACFPIDG